MKLNNNDDSHNSGLNLLIYNMLLDIESHPAWVCGLKQMERSYPHRLGIVTPCVGVWIETHAFWRKGWCWRVTPCVGVWIETLFMMGLKKKSLVTPCVGVWIETRNGWRKWKPFWWSHPAWVCGLKRIRTDLCLECGVTPCVGVWIETSVGTLKRILPTRHTLRGCVDWN